ncbi:MAG: hypothetical protein ACI89L_002558 [Phycisphaerales bacterium]
MRIHVCCIALTAALLAPLTPHARANESVADEPVARPAASPYAGHVVVRVAPTTPEQLAGVQAIAAGVISDRIGLGPIEVYLHRDRLVDLRSLGLNPEVLVEDLQARVDAQMADLADENARRAARLNSPQAVRAAVSPHDIRLWDSYRSRVNVDQHLFDLAAAYPSLATVQQIGTSVEGREIYAILISAPDTAQNPRAQRKVVQWNGTQHAREWISPMTVLYLADQLLAQSTSDPRIAGLLQTTEFAIVPISNPDGYVYSWTNYRLWRKNRSDNGGGRFGVDLNRNWSYQWGGTGSSGNTNSDTYRGPAPFSEPETTAVSDLALSFGARFAGGIDYHSHGQLILWPWGYAFAAVLPEPDRSIITGISIDMAGAILDHGGVAYSPQKATDLYPADGTADDWYQGATPGFGLTIELRTTNAFDPPRDEIMACAIENLAAALLFAEGVTQPVRIEPTAPIPAAATAGLPVTIEARILDAMGTVDTASPTLHVRYAGAASETSIPMVSTGPSTYAAQFIPTSDRGRTTVRVTAASTGGTLTSLPATGSYGITTLRPGFATLFADDFETDTGWTVGSADDDATAGLWARGNPATAPNNPVTDTTPNGTLCYVTGLAIGDDVDSGYTRLVSPEIALPTLAGDTLLAADLWRRISTTEPMLVELAPDGTEDWTTALVFWPTDANWHRQTLRVNDFITPLNSFRVRFSAMDISSDSTIESAVDGVEVLYAFETSPADVNGDGVVDNGDIGAFIAFFLAGNLAVDFNGDGVVDNGDIGAFITAFLIG